MKSNWLRQQWQPIFQPVRLLAIILLVLGVFFRFPNLDKPVYWHDEAYTSLRISGYTANEVTNQISDRFLIPIRSLEKYQYPNSEKTFIDTIYSLAIEDSQHPPLYYLLARWWVQLWGNSVAVIRSLSAIFSLLLFPAIYWLCLELFDDPLVGWVAIALLAVSPFQILLAQEARQYSLWAVMITLSSALVLHALRTNTLRSWSAYAISISLSLYTFPLTLLVVMSHGLYTFVINQARLNPTVFNYLRATIVGFATFLPWLLIVFMNSYKVEKTTDWLAAPIQFSSLVKIWCLNLSRLFIDFNSDFNYLLSNPLTYLVPATLGLSAYTIYFLCANASQLSFKFLLLILGTCSIFFVAADLIWGGRRSIIPRYLIPCYLTIQIATSYWLALKLQPSNPSLFFKRVWQSIFAGLTLLGVLSCISINNSHTWWSKQFSNSNVAIANLMNQSHHPYLVSDDSLGNILSLSYRLKDEAKLYLVREAKQQKFPTMNGDVFLLNPSQELREAITQQAGRKAKKIYRDYRFNTQLWKLT